MSKLTSFHVKIKDGRISFKSENHRTLWRRFLDQFEGQDVLIGIDEKKPTRSAEQNNLYFLYLGVIAEETGHSKDDLHDLFKGKFLGGEVVEVFGEKVRQKKSTTKLNKNDFAEYLLAIEELTGVPIPDTDAFYRSLWER